MKFPTLDRTREFGHIAGHFEHGDPMHGARFDQDGFLFSNDGQIIEAALTDADRLRLAEIQEQAEALDAARLAFRKAAPNVDPALVEKMISAEALKPAADDEGELDLVAWARGEKLYNYGKVAKAFRDRFSQSPVNKKQALEILAEHGLILPVGGAPTIPSMS